LRFLPDAKTWTEKIMNAMRLPAAWIPLGVGLSIAHGAAFASGEEPPLITVPIDTVVVTAERPRREEWIDRLPAFASVLHVDQATERLITIADVLEETAGVRIRRYGHIGAFTTASIRASSPSQVEVYLDGIPVNSAQWGGTNLAELPIGNVSRVEVFRSAAPADFVSPGLGGVVNLVSRPVRGNRTIVSATGGSHDTWKVGLLNTGRLARFEHLVSVHQLQTRGDFTYRYDPGTPAESDDDTILPRENNDFREWNALVKVTSPQLAGWRITLRDDWYLKESGLAGHRNLIFHAARFDNRRHMASLTASSPNLLEDRLRAEVTGFHIYRRDRYFNPDRETGLNRTDLIHRSLTDGARALATAFWFETRQVVKLSAELRRERFTPEDKHPQKGVGFTRERESLNLALDDALHLWPDRVTLQLGYRYRTARDNFFGPAPTGGPPVARDEHHRVAANELSAGVRFVATDALTLKANRSSYSRFPTLLELFGTGGDVISNTELVPETGVTWDAGISVCTPDDWPAVGDIELSAFHSTRDSLIYFVQNARRSFVAMNLEEAVARGIELSLRATVFERLQVDASFTTQDARHYGLVPHWNEKWLPYVSPRELFLRTSAPLWRILFRHEYRFFDWYYQDRANLSENRAAAKRLHSVGARLSLVAERLSLDFDVQNVFDKKVSDVYGYPMPGRILYLSLEVDTGEE